MKKSELVKLIQEKGQYNSEKDANSALASVVSAVSEVLGRGEDVEITGFGSFKVATQGARSGEMNGVKWSSPEKKVPKFSPGKNLKDIVAG